MFAKCFSLFYHSCTPTPQLIIYVTVVLPEQDSSTVHWELHNILSITVSSSLLQNIHSFSMTLPGT